MLNIDQALIELDSIVQTCASLKLADANEAETRRKVIDQVLEKVLGWEPVTDFKYEENNRKLETGEIQFADYVIRTASTGIIVEAKRAGKSFEIPQNRRTGKLNGFLSQGEIGEAISQATSYARELSIPFAVVSNGASWVIFPAIRIDGQKWEQSSAYIFRDLEDIKEHFVDFWELLSKQRVVEGNLEQLLLSPREDGETNRLISILKDPGYRIGRNGVYEHIEPAVHAAFSDEFILNDKAGLEHCYIKNASRVKYDKRIRAHIIDVKPTLDRKVSRPLYKKGKSDLEHHISESVPSPKKFLLVIGSVGSGKTTFLQYTRLVSAATSISGRIAWAYIDFKEATETDDPRFFIYSKLLAFIESDEDFHLGDWDKSILKAYNNYINSQAKGPLKQFFLHDKQKFWEKISEQIIKEREQLYPYVEKILSTSSERVPFYLVIDNVDQIESEDYQKRVFLETQAIARRICSNAIISLRETTYQNHKDTPLFDAFQLDTIFIDAPAITPVISRRFNYAKTVLDKRKVEIIGESGLRFTVDKLEDFFTLVSSSILSGDCGYMIEALSAGDVRRGLSLVREFLSSGHTSAEKALWTYISDGRYVFPPHEFFKGAIYGQRKHYSEQDSLIPNIYDSKLGRKELSILRLVMLNYLSYQHSTDESYEGTLVSELKSTFFILGISEPEVNKLLGDLLENRAIRTKDGGNIHDGVHIFATRFGLYLIKELAFRFEYVEPCHLDAEIFDDRYWNQLCDLTDELNASRGFDKLRLRTERVKKFIDRVADIETEWLVNVKRHKIGGAWERPVLDSQNKGSLNKNIDSVLRSGKRTHDKAKPK